MTIIMVIILAISAYLLFSKNPSTIHLTNYIEFIFKVSLFFVIYKFLVHKSYLEFSQIFIIAIVMGCFYGFICYLKKDNLLQGSIVGAVIGFIMALFIYAFGFHDLGILVLSALAFIPLTYMSKLSLKMPTSISNGNGNGWMTVGVILSVLGVISAIYGITYMNSDVNKLRGYFVEDNTGITFVILGIVLVVIGVIIIFKTKPKTTNFAVNNHGETLKKDEDMLVKLEKLGKLKETGVLSEEEFNEEKKRLLNKQS